MDRGTCAGLGWIVAHALGWGGSWHMCWVGSSAGPCSCYGPHSPLGAPTSAPSPLHQPPPPTHTHTHTQARLPLPLPAPPLPAPASSFSSGPLPGPPGLPSLVAPPCTRCVLPPPCPPRSAQSGRFLDSQWSELWYDLRALQVRGGEGGGSPGMSQGVIISGGGGSLGMSQGVILLGGGGTLPRSLAAHEYAAGCRF